MIFPDAPRPHRRELLALALAVFWFWGSAWTASRELPAVADEIAHIVGGENYWRYGVNHLQPENGYFAMHWATLPLRLHPPALPTLPAGIPESSSMIYFGNRLFYESGNNVAAMLTGGRAMMALVGAALVILIWWWARRLWGVAGGLFALLLADFCPTLLAHSGLIMSDVALSFFLLLTVTLWWSLLNRPTLRCLLTCGLSLGLLLLTKMSGVTVAPMLAGLLLLRLFNEAPLPWRHSSLTRQSDKTKSARAGPGHDAPAPRPESGSFPKLPLLLGIAAAVSVVAGTVLWAAFGFTYSMNANLAAPAPVPAYTWDALLRGGGFLSRVIGGLRELHALPEIWLQGLAVTFHDLSGRLAFLNGRTYTGGSAAYFPYAWLVKTPLPLFGLMALGIAAAGSRGRQSGSAKAGFGTPHPWPFLYAAAPLIVMTAVYWAFALTSPINIGHRHLLPLYAPMLILAAGAAGLLIHGSRPGRGLVVVLAAWFIAESVWIRPDYLAYFNPLAGGPANGYRHLVDSNVDVGQDLIRLRNWLDADTKARGAPELVFLSFFGPADPVAHGIHALRFGDNGFDARHRSYPAPVRAGLYCISVTLFQGLYTLTSGPWTSEREALYQKLIAIATASIPTSAEGITLEHLQFARVRHYLAKREPTARVGYSILVFRLRDDEVARALYGPPAGMDPAAP